MVTLYIITALLGVVLIITYFWLYSIYKRVKDLEESTHAIFVRLRKIEEYLAPKEAEPENKPVVIEAEEKDKAEVKYSNPYDLAAAILEGEEVIE